ncbi:hypothetical protein DL98DRAFT_647502 [Cadophora sp. DSE1049]|nr:hypothetical protein DL98DRAFT_647502 [Cadophora sp. DSE1049]
MSEGDDQARAVVKEEEERTGLGETVVIEVPEKQESLQNGDCQRIQDEVQQQTDGNHERINTADKLLDSQEVDRIYQNARTRISEIVEKQRAMMKERITQQGLVMEKERGKERMELRGQLVTEELLRYAFAMIRYNQNLRGVEDWEWFAAWETDLERTRPISMYKIKAWESLIKKKNSFHVLRCHLCIKSNKTFKTKETAVRAIEEEWGKHGRTIHPDDHGKLEDSDVVEVFGVPVWNATDSLYNSFKTNFEKLNRITRKNPDETSDSRKHVEVEQASEEESDQNVEGSLKLAELLQAGIVDGIPGPRLLRPTPARARGKAEIEEDNDNSDDGSYEDDQDSDEHDEDNNSGSEGGESRQDSNKSDEGKVDEYKPSELEAGNYESGGLFVHQSSPVPRHRSPVQRHRQESDNSYNDLNAFQTTLSSGSQTEEVATPSSEVTTVSSHQPESTASPPASTTPKGSKERSPIVTKASRNSKSTYKSPTPPGSQSQSPRKRFTGGISSPRQKRRKNHGSVSDEESDG